MEKWEGLLTDVSVQGLSTSHSLCGLCCHVIPQVPFSSNRLQILISSLLGQSILVKAVNLIMENFVISQQHILIMISFISVATNKATKSDILGQRSQKGNGCLVPEPTIWDFGNSERNLTFGLEIMLNYIAKSSFLATTMVTTW